MLSKVITNQYMIQIAVHFRYDGPNMATTYEQQESDEDGDPWKDSSNHGNQQLPQELINKSMSCFGLSNMSSLLIEVYVLL